MKIYSHSGVSVVFCNFKHLDLFLLCTYCELQGGGRAFSPTMFTVGMCIYAGVTGVIKKNHVANCNEEFLMDA